MSVPGIVTNADIHDALLDTELQQCYQEYLGNAVGHLKKLTFHQFVETYGAEISQLVDEVADNVGKSANDALFTDAQEEQRTAAFHADIAKTFAQNATGGLIDKWRRAKDVRFSEKLTKRIPSDARTLTSLFTLLVDDTGVSVDEYMGVLQKRFDAFSQAYMPDHGSEAVRTALGQWITALKDAIVIAAKSNHGFRATKARSQSRKAVVVDATAIGLQVRTLLAGKKGEGDVNSWIPPTSSTPYPEAVSLATSTSTYLYRDLVPSVFAWLKAAIEATEKAIFDGTPVVIQSPFGGGGGGIATSDSPLDSSNVFAQAMVMVERELDKWAAGGMKTSAEVLAEGLARNAAKMFQAVDSNNREYLTNNMLRLNAAVQNAAYAAISKHNISSDPLRHLMQTQASVSFPMDSIEANNAFVSLTLPFISERLGSAPDKSYHMWLIAPASVSAQVKQHWANWTPEQRTHYVDSHTIRSSGLGDDHNLIATTSGDLYELDADARTLYVMRPATSRGGGGADVAQVKHAISVATPPTCMSIGPHKITVLTIGAELVGCAVCGGGNKKKSGDGDATPPAKKEEEEKEPADPEDGDLATEADLEFAQFTTDTNIKDFSLAELQARINDEDAVQQSARDTINNSQATLSQKRKARSTLAASVRRQKHFEKLKRKKQKNGDSMRASLLRTAATVANSVANITLDDVDGEEEMDKYWAATNGSVTPPVPALVSFASLSSSAAAAAAAASPIMPPTVKINQAAFPPVPDLAPLPSSSTTDHKLFGDTTLQAADRLYKDKAPWSWMRDFAPEGETDLCIFLPVATNPFSDENFIEGLRQVHANYMRTAPSSERDRYADFDSTVAKRWKNVLAWFFQADTKGGVRFELHKRNVDAARKVFAILATNQMAGGRGCDWNVWQNELKDMAAQPPDPRNLHTDVPSLQLQTLANTVIEIAWSMDAFETGKRRRRSSVEAIYDLTFRNGSTAEPKTITLKPSAKDVALNTHNGWIYHVDKFFPLGLNDIYALVRDMTIYNPLNGNAK